MSFKNLCFLRGFFFFFFVDSIAESSASPLSFFEVLFLLRSSLADDMLKKDGRKRKKKKEEKEREAVSAWEWISKHELLHKLSVVRSPEENLVHKRKIANKQNYKQDSSISHANKSMHLRLRLRKPMWRCPLVILRECECSFVCRFCTYMLCRNH